MIKDFLEQGDIERIVELSGASRTYVNTVIENFHEVELNTPTRTKIVEAINTVIQERIAKTETAFQKQQKAHKLKVTRLKNCAKSLAR